MQSVGTAAPPVALHLTVNVAIVASLALVTAFAAIVVATVLTVEVTSPVSAGMRAPGSVPEVMLVATVVSVVALVANATPFVLVQVIVPAATIVQSPAMATPTAKLDADPTKMSF